MSAFFAGREIARLETQIFAATTPWIGSFLARQVRRATAMACSRAGRTETELQIRDLDLFAPDAVHLSPAQAMEKEIFSFYDGETPQEIAEFLSGLRSRRLDIPEALDRAWKVGLAAAGSAGPDKSPMPWLAADAALAQSLRWPRRIPLLATKGGIRAGLVKDLAIAATEASGSAQSLDEADRRLAEAAEKIRMKKISGVVDLVRNRDAVTPAIVTKTLGLTRRASLRCLERLVMLKALSELSARSTHKSYGFPP